MYGYCKSCEDQKTRKSKHLKKKAYQKSASPQTLATMEWKYSLPDMSIPVKHFPTKLHSRNLDFRSHCSRDSDEISDALRAIPYQP